MSEGGLWVYHNMWTSKASLHSDGYGCCDVFACI